jgi:hypothetical protein
MQNEFNAETRNQKHKKDDEPIRRIKKQFGINHGDHAIAARRCTNPVTIL